ncbi:DUF4326 domain-containing protein [Pseudoroseomonas cervicalis]|uniref:DUF4326 domain-containing protein n=1 Tax=Teichococcus cervicalis TaxID=204525 RepID=UPI0027D8FFE9|nr:DUF4326 domain-containing protein [Pseudoroseomonas cervicalis]
MPGDHPQRIQLRRLKGWRMPENTVRVCRPGIFGNPWRHTDAAVAVRMYRVWLTGGMRSLDMFDCTRAVSGNLSDARRNVLAGLPTLRGKNLACWCRPGTPCHADVLLEMANA